MASDIGGDWRTRRMRASKWLWAVCILLGAMLVWFGLTKLANAHITGHEEWNDVLSASTNQYNGPCCGLGDAQLVEFDDWRLTKDGTYEVYVQGQWRGVEGWKITTNVMNPTGRAVIWYATEPRWEGDTGNVRLTIYCFKPLETY